LPNARTRSGEQSNNLMRDSNQPGAGLALIFLLAIALFVISSVMSMLGPLLVPMAAELHTSLAVAGQLVTVTSLVWGLTAFGAGPLSDAYGRRNMLLIGLLFVGLGLIGAALAQTYAWLFASRVITGFGGAMISPTCFAAAAELVLIQHRSRIFSWLSAASVLGASAGVPLVAWVVSLDGWRMPFWIGCALCAALLAWTWGIFPRHVAALGPTAGFMSRVREASVHGSSFWMLLAVNLLAQIGFWGLIVYLPAYLMQTYQLSTSGTIWPLSITGAGMLCGALAGGQLANFSARRMIAVGTLLAGGLLAAYAYAVPLSIGMTVAMVFGSGGLLMSVQPMILTLLIGLAGEARGTATGIFALSTQLGAMAGTGLGGLLLALGGFPYVGLGCLGMAVIAAITIARTSLHIPDSEQVSR
jgi:MFS transporter, DHA1 family, chloramphenicol resistance protein